MKHRNWVFTSFDEIAPVFTQQMKYLCFQRELSPGTKKLHWQGYVEFKECHILTDLKKGNCNGYHWEPRKGSQKQAIEYCCKKDSSIENTFTEYGHKGQQGNRTDLDGLVDAIEDGYTMKEMLLAYRGNALRHLGMIERGLSAYHEQSSIDRHILDKRENPQDYIYPSNKIVSKNAEVTGNTNCHSLDDKEKKEISKEMSFLNNSTEPLRQSDSLRSNNIQIKKVIKKRVQK